MTLVTPISLLLVLPYIGQIWLWFLCIWRIIVLCDAWQRAKATALHSFRCFHWSAFVSGAHQRGRVGLTFCLPITELCLFVVVHGGPPSARGWEDAEFSFLFLFFIFIFTFWKFTFCKLSHLLCPIFWMLLTSASTTLIRCATFSMIEFKSLQMLMVSKRTYAYTITNAHTDTHNQTQIQRKKRALSWDELPNPLAQLQYQL